MYISYMYDIYLYDSCSSTAFLRIRLGRVEESTSRKKNASLPFFLAQMISIGIFGMCCSYCGGGLSLLVVVARVGC